MLTVLKQDTLLTSNFPEPAPDIYIDSVELESNGATVFYRISDNGGTWLNDSTILENIFVSMSCGDKVSTESLSSVKKRTKIVDGSVIDSIFFEVDTSNLSVKACCYNENLRGIEVIEQVTTTGSLNKISYRDTEYKYINKNKDLSLLDISDILLGSDDTSKQNTYISDFMVSYDTNKVANIGFVFNLENFLNNKSDSYNTLKRYKDYKNIILNNSYIIPESIVFYKKNITINGQEYLKIDSQAKVIKLQDGIDNNLFLITCSDINDDKSDMSRYHVKVTFSLKDYSYDIFKKLIHENIKTSKDFVISYKNTFENISKNNLIDNKQVYFFENEYEKYLPSIKEAVENLSSVYSFYTGNDKNEYYSLLTSIFNPLTARTELFERLLHSIERLETYLERIVTNINTSGVPGIGFLQEYSPQIIYEFNKDGDDYIDYNYDLNYGFEVISTDQFFIRQETKPEGFKTITYADWQERKLLESKKFFNSVDPKIYSKINHFSISFLDLGKKHYDLLFGNDIETVPNYNEIFCLLNEYNDHVFRYSTLESYYFQTLDNDIYIKTIGSKNNSSINNLEKTTIFDPNLDSKQKSLEFIASTGLTYLYLFIDNNLYIKPKQDCLQYQATLQTGSSTGTVFPISEETLKDPESKPKAIIHYNNLFLDKLIASGDNYEIRTLEEYCVSPLFSKKMKIFNKFYIIEKKKSSVITVEEQKYAFINELTYNVETKYLNRRTNSSKILTTVDIL